jgi:predicted nucleotidyltransferase component of viral defense system
MPTRDRGSSPAGFRAQLLARLRNQAHAAGVSAQRLQQRVAFERFLARLGPSGDWVLKGGFALELRYGWGSRPTKDIDLRVASTLEAALAELRTTIAESTSADHFSFELAEAGQELQGAPGGTQRLQVHARLAGESLARFHIDVSSGDALVTAPDTLEGSDLLRFAGIEPIRIPVYPVIQHLAEKLHTYTLPRSEANTRAKDLVDLVTLATVEAVEGDALLTSVQATFSARASHDLPAALPPPPTEWAAPYVRLAGESPLTPIADLQAGFALAVAFWQPVLDGVVVGRRWQPQARTWQFGTYIGC